MKKIKVAILGSGNIGTDLLVKILRSPILTCSLFIGRNLSSRGMSKALSLSVNVSDQGIDAIIKNPDYCDLVFDATSALSHRHHAQILRELDKVVIDLTPANVGHFCISAVNLDECLNYKNINMVTCGGQASIPLSYVIGQTQKEIDYIEVVSTIASRSAGPATRLNIDEYIETTERGIELFSKCKKVKAILNLNPAEPCIDMQTTIYALVKNPDLDILKKGINEMVQKIQRYVPGYSLIIPPTYENNRIVISVRVRGLGDYLPSYAGNLDIINCAAITVAEEYAKLMASR
ncbi:MAG: acetaldehyde dehydrogenase (acetylating) [Acetobacterium woodii]|nr:acetaldehyde dehydrogenase (acetylating) [Acetobacterium woodii]MBI5677834.1 acetaldehyde dehydrogenase (acetylating) [Planctomycetota bacterium]